ncbi:MAG: hypothetical protein RLZZ299_3019 [Pseudomonadota bacterium]|jgi:prepilin-type N-terminal cleavage/methylation domain-containing protein
MDAGTLPRLASRARRRTRAGVTLVEIMIVVAIMGILAGLSAPMFGKSIPRWRCRRAAKEFAANVALAREIAIAQNVEVRLRMDVADPNLADQISYGAYSIAVGNRTVGSTSWDILPVEPEGSTTDQTTDQGTFDISHDAQNALKYVSLEPWSTLRGTSTGNDIVFNARGWVTNPAGDFNSNGYIAITFRDVRIGGSGQRWTVRINRAGTTDMVSSLSADQDVPASAAGTPTTTTFSNTSGRGYHP